jgi:hypothetical protein
MEKRFTAFLIIATVETMLLVTGIGLVKIH